MSEPKPATGKIGEWEVVPQTSNPGFFNLISDQGQVVAYSLPKFHADITLAAINAALDAARDKVENLHGVLGKKRAEIKQLNQQLAAAQADNERLMQQYEMTALDCKNAREREAKLAEATKPLVDAATKALHEMCHTTAPRDSFTDAVDLLEAALAKVGK